MADLQFQIDILTAQGIRSVADLDKMLKLLKNSLVTVTTQAERTQIALAIKDYSLIRQQWMGAGAAIQGTQTASANASMALMNLNYVVRDSPYFFNNFALGVLAVGNNINPLIDSFARLRREAGEKSVTTFQLLRKALVGGAGISIAFSVVVTAIQAYVFHQSRANSEAKKGIETSEDLANAIIKQVKGVNELAEAYKQLRTEQLVTATAKLNEKLEEQYTIIKKRIDLTLMVNQLGGMHLGLLGRIFGYSMDLTDDEIEALKKIRENMDAIDKIQEKGKSRIDRLKEEIKYYEQLRDAIPDGVSLEVYRTYNAEIEKRRKEIELLTGKVKELKKEYLEAGNAAKRMFREMAVSPDTRFGREAVTTESQARLGGLFGITPRPSEDSRAKGIREEQKKLNLEIEMGKIAARELGNALEEAFTRASFVLEEFIMSLYMAIMKMLILQAVANALLPGSGSAVSSIATAAVAPKVGGFNKVMVEGTLRANRNEFIADVKNAENYYNKNEGFIRVGR